MTLEELKAAWDAAVKALEASPEDKNLKAKAKEAQDAYEAKLAEDDDTDDEDEELGEVDDKTKKYIAKLRKENAAQRVKNKDLKKKITYTEEQKRAILKAAGIDSEEEDPTETIKLLRASDSEKDFQLAILRSAVEQRIPSDAVEFYEFLVRKATSELEEGEELDDEVLKQIVVKSRKHGKMAANTSVDEEKGKKPPPPGGGKEISLDQFCLMSMMEKDKLFREQPEVCQALMKEARAKKKLV